MNRSSRSLAFACLASLASLVSLVAVAACSSASSSPGGGSPDAGPVVPPPTASAIRHTIFLQAVGVAGTGLVVANNGGDTLPVPKNGGYTFASTLAPGDAYEVTVQSQPASPAQACDVKNGKGTMGTYDVKDVTVECATTLFAVGGTVTGLTGGGLILQNDFGDDLRVSGSGPFTFKTKLPPGEVYRITVSAEPVGQTCTVSKEMGTMPAMDVKDVQVACAP
jgi:hypothetical protein